MAKLDGNNYKLYVDSSTPGTFSPLLGQRELSVDFSTGTFSNASKDSTYDTQGVGLTSVGITVACVPDLPDATGYTRLETLAASKAEVILQVRKSPFSGSDVVFAAPCKVSGFNKAYPFNDAVGTQITAVISGAPTTNALA